MAPEPSDLERDDEPRGLSRRSLIKRAAAAGAVAWTAPLIIDSLASPAAAATVAPGCYVMYSSATNGTWGAWQTTQPPNSGPACVPSGPCTPSASSTALAALNVPVPSVSNGGTELVTVTVKSGYSCRIVSASATTERFFSDEANWCGSSGGADGSDGGVTFGGQPGTSVTVQPTGWFTRWDTNVQNSNASMIGVIVQCP